MRRARRRARQVSRRAGPPTSWMSGFFLEPFLRPKLEPMSEAPGMLFCYVTVGLVGLAVWSRFNSSQTASLSSGPAADTPLNSCAPTRTCPSAKATMLQRPSDRSRADRCDALHCTALHCTALHCTALHCTALHCTVVRFIPVMKLKLPLFLVGIEYGVVREERRFGLATRCARSHHERDLDLSDGAMGVECTSSCPSYFVLWTWPMS